MKTRSWLSFTFFMLFLSFSVSAQNNKIVIQADKGEFIISKHIYGHFAEHLGHGIYGGIWVGENSAIPNTRGIRNDVVQALKNLHIPNLRWPGGCFADDYHWMDGIGPKSERPKMINTNWGGVVEDNSFGTHEFLDLCEQLGCEPYICGNVGSGTVEEMSKWIEYITFDGKSPMTDLRKKNGREQPWKVKFWGVGNESWGCGGNMTPDYYADLYKRYATFCRNYGNNWLFKIASGANEGDVNWTETLMKKVGRQMSGISLHYYTLEGDWGHKGSATNFTEEQYFTTIKKALRMNDLIRNHSAVMDQYDPEKRIALIPDEWGVWYDVEPGTNPSFLYQQNTLRDALIAAVTFDVFNKSADRVKMANIAQMVNVLQSVILTKEDKMILTPTYWAFDLYKVHQDATFLPLTITCEKYKVGDEELNALSATASKDAQGKIHITISNVDLHNTREISCELAGINIKKVTGIILTSNNIDDHNTFENPDLVKTKEFRDVKIRKNTLSVDLPSKSIVMLEIN